MTAHPALLAVMMVDAAAILVLATALVGAVRVVLGWDAGAATRTQLARERVSEEISSLARLALVLQALAGLVLIVVVNHVLPSSVPGAMCGVGALQAMPGGTLSLTVRGIGLAGLWVWSVIDVLNRRAPLAPLATTSARALLVVAPLASVAAWQTSQALLHLDVEEPVSCCAAVYDLARVGTGQEAGASVAGPWHALAAALGMAALIVGGSLLRRRASGGWTVVWAAAALGWTGLAAWVLVDAAGPYLYQVLGHRCPLCFFLPEHGGVGYLLFGGLVLTTAGALGAATAAVAAQRGGIVSMHARALVRRGLALGMVGMVVFALVASLPAIVWRLRFGVWISG